MIRLRVLAILLAALAALAATASPAANRSGNARDGEAFVLVQRKDHDLHVHGTGKDRRMIVARYGEETASPAPGDATESTPATGGAAAPAA